MKHHLLFVVFLATALTTKSQTPKSWRAKNFFESAQFLEQKTIFTPKYIIKLIKPKSL